MENNLEWQVTNLELSQKLKSLGYKQEGLFWWSKQGDQKTWKVEHGRYFAVDKRQDCVAPTVVELGKWLPTDHPIPQKFTDGWGGVVGAFHVIGAKTMANAYAKWVIWLRENNYINFKEENE